MKEALLAAREALKAQLNVTEWEEQEEANRLAHEALALIESALSDDVKDAERYKFLRQRDHGRRLGVEVRLGGYSGMYWHGADGPLSGDKLDAAIDAAIAAAQKGAV